MANTVIALKKSGIPFSVPSNLANGEIAINYADGKLFYKDSSGTIQQISGGGNTFSTINAAGTLVVSDLQNDILTLEQSDNIIITGDAINDKIIIAANLTAANNWSNTKLSNGTVTLDGALTTTGQIYVNSQITIYPTGGDEGGEIQLFGTGSYPDWSIDSYQDQLRFFTVNTGIQNINFFNAGGGSVKLGVNTGNPQYELDVSGDVNVSGKFRINGTELLTGTADLTPANNYTNTSVAAANNYAGFMANAANSYAASLTPDLTAANNWANTKVASVTGTAGEIYSSGGTTPTLNLISTGVVATTYGGATQIPVIAVDSLGRLTTASNVAVQGMDYEYVNTSVGGANNWTNNVGQSANSYAGYMANSANAYAASLTPDLSPAFNKANDAYAVANAAFDFANGVSTNTTAAFNLANTAIYSLTPANNWANTINTAIQTQFPAVNNFVVSAITSNTAGANGWANGINTFSQLTYLKLNTPGTVQTITSDVSIVGNLSISGNTTTISANNLSVRDSLIYLSVDNDVSDLVDIGFVGHYNNGSANLHTGLYRDHASKQYFLFSNLDGPEPASLNDIVPYANGMINAALNADLITSNLTLGGANAIVTLVNNAAGANGWANNINTAIQTQFPAVNNYTISVGTAANSYAGAMANSGNAWATATFATITNAAAAFAKANTALANASGTVFSGNFLATGSGTFGFGSTNNIGFSNDGAIEIQRNTGGAYIDFKGTNGGDFDTRIQSIGDGSANGSLIFFAGGSERFRIANNNTGGFVRINTNTNFDILSGLNGEAFHTYRTGVGAWFHAGKSNTSGGFTISEGVTPLTTPLMTILSGGNLGIGNTNPQARLHVTAASTTAPSLTWGATAGQILRNEDSELAFGLSNASPFPLWIQGRNTLNAARNIVLQPLGGNVGIGTSSPSTNLEIVSPDSVQARLSASTNGIDCRLSSLGLTGNAGQVGTWSNHPFVIRTNDAERLRIDSSGNVAIGRSTANYRLDVNGTINAANILINGNAISVDLTAANNWSNTLYVLSLQNANNDANSSNSYANATFYTIANGTAAFARANTSLANVTNTTFTGNLITSGVVRSTGLQDSTGRTLIIRDSAGTVVWGN